MERSLHRYQAATEIEGNVAFADAPVQVHEKTVTPQLPGSGPGSAVEHGVVEDDVVTHGLTVSSYIDEGDAYACW